MDTLVDPVEMVSSSHLPVAPRVAVDTPPRASLPSFDPEAQVQWFSRAFQDEAATSVDVPVVTAGMAVGWEEENDTSPTLVLPKNAYPKRPG